MVASPLFPVLPKCASPLDHNRSASRGDRGDKGYSEVKPGFEVGPRGRQGGPRGRQMEQVGTERETGGTGSDLISVSLVPPTSHPSIKQFPSEYPLSHLSPAKGKGQHAF